MKRAAEEGTTAAVLIALPLAIWGVHFLFSYIVAAVYCARSNGIATAIPSIRWLVLAITIAAIAAIGLTLRQGHHRYRRNASGHPVSNSPAQRNQARFFWTVLLSMSALGTFAILCVAGAALFFGDCR